MYNNNNIIQCLEWFDKLIQFNISNNNKQGKRQVKNKTIRRDKQKTI